MSDQASLPPLEPGQCPEVKDGRRCRLRSGHFPEQFHELEPLPPDPDTFFDQA